MRVVNVILVVDSFGLVPWSLFIVRVCQDRMGIDWFFFGTPDPLISVHPFGSADGGYAGKLVNKRAPVGDAGYRFH
jgi:hypothetical protein